MNAIILSVGDELVLGQTVDTNSAWLSAQLSSVGCDILRHETVPDDQPAIEEAIARAAKQCDVLLVSGGIGPTEDDLTRQALARVMSAPLELNDEWLRKLLEFFKARGRAMPETNKIQAMIPRGATMIFNTAGTAAGIEVFLPLLPGEGSGESSSELANGVKSEQLAPHPNPLPGYRERELTRGCHVFVMPGVPKEMKAMFTLSALPFIKAESGGAVILQKTLHTFGLGESHVAEKLGDLMKRGRNPSVGTTVANGIVSLRLNARFDSLDRAQAEMKATFDACYEKLGDLIFGEDGKSIQEAVADLLKSAGKTVTTAESCTGGLLAKYLTDISGSSDYFKQGWIVYSNQTKQQMLNVPADMLATHGAVSEPVVQLLASNARATANADFALAISGVAGPTGGSEAKPVGTVCIALASDRSVQSRTFNFPGDREMVRDRSAKMALTMLRYSLLGKAMPF